MSSPTPGRRALEELWHQRLKHAKLRLDFARHYMSDVKRDFSSGDIPENQEAFAHEKALLTENFALGEYNSAADLLRSHGERYHPRRIRVAESAGRRRERQRHSNKSKLFVAVIRAAQF